MGVFTHCVPRFDSVSSVLAGRIGGPRSGRTRRNTPLAHLKELQLVAMDAIRDPNTPVAVKAAIMRAYVDIQETRMSLEGIGRPKPVEARNATTKRKPSTTAGPLGRVSRAREQVPLSSAQDIATPQAPAQKQSNNSPDPGEPAK